MSVGAKKKSSLVDTQAKNNNKYQVAIENLMKGIQQQMSDMKGSCSEKWIINRNCKE